MGRGNWTRREQMLKALPMSEECAAQGTGSVANGKDAERSEQRGGRILGWKKELAQDGCEKAVDGKVVPLEHVADRAGGHIAKSPRRLRDSLCGILSNGGTGQRRLW